MFDVLHFDTPHFLFAGRFVVYTLAIVLLIGTARDIIELRKFSPRVRSLTRSHHLTIIFACIGLMLSSPAEFHVMRRLFGVPRIGFPTDLLLMISVVFTILFFIYAQVTRARSRMVDQKRIRFGIYATLIATALLTAVGLGIDV